MTRKPSRTGSDLPQHLVAWLGEESSLDPLPSTTLGWLNPCKAHLTEDLHEESVSCPGWLNCRKKAGLVFAPSERSLTSLVRIIPTSWVQLLFKKHIKALTSYKSP